MGQLLTFEAEITAGQQFLGTEFKITPPKRDSALRLVELDLKMGVESKTFRIEKRNSAGDPVALIQQSVDSMGAPAASTAESVILKGPDIELLFAPGDQPSITTTGATAAMRAKLYFEEVPFTK